MKGDIIWDSISTLEFTMKSGSSLTGAIVDDETNAGNGGDGSANVTIKKSDGTVIKKGSSCYTIAVDSYSAS